MIAQEKPIHVDVPVTLADVKAVFSIASLSFEGDLPASLFHLQLIVDDVARWEARSQVVAVFHTNAGHATLHDRAYNADRNIATGNPYRTLVTDLMARGVQVELCGATAKSHGWGNEDVIPRNQNQHRRDGQDDSARSTGFCEDLRILTSPHQCPGAHRMGRY